MHPCCTVQVKIVLYSNNLPFLLNNGRKLKCSEDRNNIIQIITWFKYLSGLQNFKHFWTYLLSKAYWCWPVCCIKRVKHCPRRNCDIHWIVLHSESVKCKLEYLLGVLDSIILQYVCSTLGNYNNHVLLDKHSNIGTCTCKQLTPGWHAK